MIRVVFLDIDNTLLSFSGYVKEAMKDGFARFGLPSYTEPMFDVFQKINNNLWNRIEQGALSLEELMKIRWNMIFDELGIDFDGVAFEKYFRNRLFDSAVPEPGARELLDYLCGRYALCVVSNGPYDQQINRLRVGKIHDYFRGFFISSRIGAQKPSYAFFDYCFDELRKGDFPDLSPQEVMIVGDSVSADIKGGKMYGMQTCLYQSSATESDCDEADYVVANLLEIKRIL